MRRSMSGATFACLLVMHGPAAFAQDAAEDMLGVASNGIFRLDSGTGAGRLINRAGATHHSLARSSRGIFHTAVEIALVTVDPVTGDRVTDARLTIGNVRGLSYSGRDVLYAIEDGGPGAVDLLYTIDLAIRRGEATRVGATGLRRMEGLAFAPDGTLYGWDLDVGLVTLDAESGRATDVNPDVIGPRIESITFARDGTLFGGGAALYRVDPDSGVATRVGSGGYEMLGGISFLDGDPGVCGRITRLLYQCKDRRLKVVVKSTLPEGTELTADNEGDRKPMTLNRRGKGKAKWRRQSGNRRVRLVECPNRACIVTCFEQGHSSCNP